MLDVPIRAAMFLGLFSLLFELFAALLKIRFVRIAFYGGTLVLSGFAATLLLMADPGALTFLIWLVAVFRMLNAARALSFRMHERKLILVTRRTSLSLIALQLVALLIWTFDRLLEIETLRWLYALVLSGLLVNLALNLVVGRNLRRSLIRPSDKYRSDHELPTVSVCIPARNETDDLPAVLESVLASNYPKLEVLVLDDCSQDRTSEIIKGFASRGVRFIKGDQTKKGWLAKNQAYQTLTEAANGELLLFCGVDVRFGKQAVWAMVDVLSSRNKKMISMLPKSVAVTEADGLVQPMRHWWELALPRRLFNRPPVLSNCWLIARSDLKKLGGFKAVDNSVIPEGYFARELAKQDGYSFLRSYGKLDISSAKDFSEQWETAVRTRYPELRKRPEAVLLMTLIEIWLLVLPLGLFVAGFFTSFGLLWLLASLSALGLGLIHYRIIRASGGGPVSLPLALLPAAVLVEIYLLQYSMLRYEFGTVVWKERNICIPVMRAVPRLPKA